VLDDDGLVPPPNNDGLGSPPNGLLVAEPVAFEEPRVPKAGLEPRFPNREVEEVTGGVAEAEFVVLPKLKRLCPVPPVAFDDAEVDESPGFGANKLVVLERLFDVAPNGAELGERLPNKPPPEGLLSEV
jgi:hypothetical protein